MKTPRKTPLVKEIREAGGKCHAFGRCQFVTDFAPIFVVLTATLL
jgi:hypothetical protein